LCSSGQGKKIFRLQPPNRVYCVIRAPTKISAIAWVVALASIPGLAAQINKTDVPIQSQRLATSISGIQHIIWVWFENREASDITSVTAPYFTSFAAANVNLTNFYGVSHPSQPNYLDGFSGSNHGIISDNYCTFSASTDNLARQLAAAGKSWRAYAQNFPGGCSDITSSTGGVDGPGLPGQYVRKHNPAISFEGVRFDASQCANIQPLASFDPTVNFAMVIPNMTNDMHDGTTAQGDAFLQAFVPLVTASPDWAHTLLIVSFDEGSTSISGGGHIYTAAAAPWLAHANVTTTYNHFSVLRTIEEVYGLPFLGSATTAATMAELLPQAPTPTPGSTPSPTATPPPTPSPTPTATPTGTPTPPVPTPTYTPGQCAYVFLDQNFDGVTAPALPPGWTSSFTPGPANCTPAGTCALGTPWTTSTTNPSSAPNCAFHDAPSCVTDSSLYSPTFFNGTTGSVLVFNNNFDLPSGLDGAVLEISINGGPFVDFVSAGGLFNAGGYTGTISTAFQSPIGGRQAWTGLSNGGMTVARMPDAAGGQGVVLRFRLVTDCSGAGTGQRIDNIKITFFAPCATATPSPTATATGTPPPTPTATPPSPTPSPSATTTPCPIDGGCGDPPVVKWWIGSYNVSENAGGVTVILQHTGNRDMPATVHCATNDGTAASGSDYTATSINVTFAPGELFKQFVIPILDDGIAEPSETFTVTLSAISGATIGFPSIAIVTIEDNEIAPTPTSTPTATPTPTPSSTPAAQALNLSTRMRVQTGDNVGIGGFIITGSAPKHLLLRAIGPSLTQFGVSGALADPVLELQGPGGFVPVTNDNWRDDPVQEAAIIATGSPPTSNLESAIDATLNPAAYTAILRGKDDSAGVALIEVYDLSQAVPAKLANISTRAFVATGDNIVIGGFVLGRQNGADRVVLRGIGPSLTALGVPGALADPTLELRDGNGTLLALNNDWQDDPTQAAELVAAGLAPANQLESGMAMTLLPGAYTALLDGLNHGTGVGLVEIYDRGGPP
jgi:hypothetical protein